MKSSVAAIILAGGRSTRMGADKAQVRVNGVRLIDELISSLPANMDFVVVSPFELGLPTISEDPPFGGPVAGIAAGLEHLNNLETAGSEFVAVLAVDAPASAGLVGKLVGALDSSTSECAVIVSAGRVQPLCALWRRAGLKRALGALGTVRDQPAMRLIRAARGVEEVPGDGRETDYDTVKDLKRLGNIEL